MTHADTRCTCCPQCITILIGRQLLCVSPHQPSVTYSHSCIGCDAPIPSNRYFCDDCEVAVSRSDPAFPSAGVTTVAASVPKDVVVVVTTSFAERSSRAIVAEVLRPASDDCGKDLLLHSGEIPGLGTTSDDLDSVVAALEVQWVDGARITGVDISAACIACPAFLASRNATTFLVAADSEIHVVSSSSMPST